ncbi:hypothetical protein M427DRAFT_446935 [Gonapodya prolifera JEL478]|uniref:Uncharacterized protein n=1 Tax=Gonapodya prolifera (strain JEL478) TaxID=1344416 RepID=A0A139A2R5_GONPJ|nr:hypothetical protein M427DRAFT_446935 [Gonapodya prolifera JEL478]|eukprot:KXS11080.1 hypothetical protein M427DRAFT_446935 [Gonapodya prolifera JEL478]
MPLSLKCCSWQSFLCFPRIWTRFFAFPVDVMANGIVQIPLRQFPAKEGFWLKDVVLKSCLGCWIVKAIKGLRDVLFVNEVWTNILVVGESMVPERISNTLTCQSAFLDNASVVSLFDWMDWMDWCGRVTLVDPQRSTTFHPLFS